MSQPSEPKSGIWQDIPLVREGDDRTLLSAALVNELITRINALSRLRGEGGCRVVRSDENMIVTTDGI